jgi:hypothetical protein
MSRDTFSTPTLPIEYYLNDPLKQFFLIWRGANFCFAHCANLSCYGPGVNIYAIFETLFDPIPLRDFELEVSLVIRRGYDSKKSFPAYTKTAILSQNQGKIQKCSFSSLFAVFSVRE